MNQKSHPFFRIFVLASISVLLLAGSAPLATQAVGSAPIVQEAAAPGDPAALAISPQELVWTPQSSFAGFLLTVGGPGDFYTQQRFAAGATPVLSVIDGKGNALPDGLYAYSLSALPSEASITTDLRSMSGFFSVQDGAFVLPQSEQPDAQDGAASPAAPLAPLDQVIPDDLIVQQSLCVGFDCVVNENFGFDTIRLKENNTRIGFTDTSVGTFPTNDWQIVANDSASGGASYLAFYDVTGGRTSFRVMAGAPDNALFVGASGRIGLNTNTPQGDLHVFTPYTPTLRLEQSGSVLPAQTWDLIGSDEAFSVGDATHGGAMPLRIRPGAPGSSLDIDGAGNIGLGTDAPQASLHVVRSNVAETVSMRIEHTATGQQWNMILAPDGKLQIAETNPAARPEFTLDGNGNLFITGALAQGSDVASKQDFTAIDGEGVLQKLADLPITTWSYKGDNPSVRHMGPTAQDFYAAFNLGADDTHISPLDASSVALAGVQELHKSAEANATQVAGLEAANQALGSRLAELEAQNAELEARLAALESGSQSSPGGSAAVAPWFLLGAALSGLALWRKRS